MNEFEEFQDAWKDQTFDIKEIDMDKIKLDAKKLDKDILRRNSLEWMACLIIIPIFIKHALEAKTVFSSLMNIEIAFGALFIGLHLFYRGRKIKAPQDSLNSEDFLHHERDEILKQIKLLSNVRYWYVAPIFIGLIGLTSEKIYLKWDVNNLPMGLIAYLISCILLAAGIIWLNEVKGVNELKEKLKGLS